MFAPLQEKILVVGRALQCSEPFEKASHLTSLYNATQVGRSQRERRRQQKIQSRGLLMLVFNDPAFIRPATDQAGYLLPWVVSQGRSFGFLRADSSIRNVRNEIQLRQIHQYAFANVLTTLVKVH